MSKVNATFTAQLAAAGLVSAADSAANSDVESSGESEGTPSRTIAQTKQVGFPGLGHCSHVWRMFDVVMAVIVRFGGLFFPPNGLTIDQRYHENEPNMPLNLSMLYPLSGLVSVGRFTLRPSS